MKNAEFNMLIRPLNKKYMELFQEVPCIEHYACTREEFLQAMEQAISDNREISTIIPSVVDYEKMNEEV